MESNEAETQLASRQTTDQGPAENDGEPLLDNDEEEDEGEDTVEPAFFSGERRASATKLVKFKKKAKKVNGEEQPSIVLNGASMFDSFEIKPGTAGDDAAGKSSPTASKTVVVKDLASSEAQNLQAALAAHRKDVRDLILASCQQLLDSTSQSLATMHVSLGLGEMEAQPAGQLQS